MFLPSQETCVGSLDVLPSQETCVGSLDVLPSQEAGVGSLDVLRSQECVGSLDVFTKSSDMCRKS